MKKKFNKLVIFDNLILTPEQKEKLMSFAEEVVFYPKTDDLKLVKKRIRDADAVINCWTIITEDALDESKVKYIGNWGHWWKHRITVSEEKLKEMGIHLDHIPDYGTDSVAELVWSGILALSKNLERWHRDAERGRWVYENIKRGDKIVEIPEIRENILKDKVLGIVGMGRIGSRVAQIGINGFGMKVIYYSRTRKKELEKVDIEFVSLQKLFEKSNIISIHVSPDVPRRFISKDLLKLMKPDTIFVNTSVGHAIDQDSLIDILKQGKIKAFLDVYEKFPPKKELKNLSNVIFTYRLGWFSKEAIITKGNKLIGNIEKYLERENISK